MRSSTRTPPDGRSAEGVASISIQSHLLFLFLPIFPETFRLSPVKFAPSGVPASPAMRRRTPRRAFSSRSRVVSSSFGFSSRFPLLDLFPSWLSLDVFFGRARLSCSCRSSSSWLLTSLETAGRSKMSKPETRRDFLLNSRFLLPLSLLLSAAPLYPPFSFPLPSLFSPPLVFNRQQTPRPST